MSINMYLFILVHNREIHINEVVIGTNNIRDGSIICRGNQRVIKAGFIVTFFIFSTNFSRP